MYQGHTAKGTNERNKLKEKQMLNTEIGEIGKTRKQCVLVECIV